MRHRVFRGQSELNHCPGSFQQTAFGRLPRQNDKITNFRHRPMAADSNERLRDPHRRYQQAPLAQNQAPATSGLAYACQRRIMRSVRWISQQPVKHVVNVPPPMLHDIRVQGYNYLQNLKASSIEVVQHGGEISHACRLVWNPPDTRVDRSFGTTQNYTRICATHLSE